jgi:hypothetical protein
MNNSSSPDPEMNLDNTMSNLESSNRTNEEMNDEMNAVNAMLNLQNANRMNSQMNVANSLKRMHNSGMYAYTRPNKIKMPNNNIVFSNNNDIQYLNDNNVNYNNSNNGSYIKNNKKGGADYSDVLLQMMQANPDYYNRTAVLRSTLRLTYPDITPYQEQAAIKLARTKWELAHHLLNFSNRKEMNERKSRKKSRKVRKSRKSRK